MATRDEVHAKYGAAMEAAQMFEAEVGLLILCVESLEKGLYREPDRAAAKDLIANIDSQALGQLLHRVRKQVTLLAHIDERFKSGLKARNMLAHGFFHYHSEKIKEEAGRATMVRDLEVFRAQLEAAWQSSIGATRLAVGEIINRKKAERSVSKPT